MRPCRLPAAPVAPPTASLGAAGWRYLDRAGMRRAPSPKRVAARLPALPRQLPLGQQSHSRSSTPRCLAPSRHQPPGQQSRSPPSSPCRAARAARNPRAIGRTIRSAPSCRLRKRHRGLTRQYHSEMTAAAAFDHRNSAAVRFDVFTHNGKPETATFDPPPGLGAASKERVEH